MKRTIFFVYGVGCHLFFLALYAYLACFVGNLWGPKTIDSGTATEPLAAIAINLGLVVLFGLQHSVMARPAFKVWWTRFVPQPIERSTYVLFSCMALIALMALWQPLPTRIWHFEEGVIWMLLSGLFWAGWLMVPLVSFLIDHFDLFGTRQVWLHFKNRAYRHLPFRKPGLYARIRHPLYVGWIVAFWATPSMSLGHLLFAFAMTTYMLLAIPLEERDLEGVFGDEYRAYRRTVPALIPALKLSPAESNDQALRSSGE